MEGIDVKAIVEIAGAAIAAYAAIKADLKFLHMRVRSVEKKADNAHERIDHILRKSP